MPLKPHDNQQIGFDVPTFEFESALTPTEKPVGKQAPFMVPEPVYDFVRSVPSAFRQSNDMVNAFQWMTEAGKDWGPPDGLDLQQQLHDDELWDKYRDKFVGVHNKNQYLHIKAKIEQEEWDRQLLSETGLAGMVANMGSAIISPVSLIPLTWGAKGAKVAATQGAALGFLGGALQEIPLQSNQLTRSLEESAINVLFTGIAGGLLGGAAGFLKNNQTARALGEAIRADMASGFGSGTIPAGVGADIAGADLGGLAPSYGTGNFAAKIGNIVAQNLTQDFSTEGRRLTALISDGGMDLEGYTKGLGVKGGNAEANISARRGELWTAIEDTQSAYSDYFFQGQSKGGFLRNTRAVIGGTAQRALGGELISPEEFRQRVFLSIATGDADPIPQVTAMADKWQNMLVALGEELEELGLINKLTDTEDATYIPHMWNQEMLKADAKGFREMLSQDLIVQLRAEADKLALQFAEKGGKNWVRNAEDILREWGVEDAVVTVKGVQGNFAKWADEVAEEALNKIRGDTIVLPRHHDMTTKRGAMMVRSLNVSAAKYQRWLVTDIQQVMHKYHSMVVPEIELANKGIKLHDVDDNNKPVYFTKLYEEEHRLVDETVARLRKEGASQKELDAAQLKIAKDFDKVRENVRVMIDRLRNIRSLPKDPDSLVYRMGRSMLQLSAAARLGGVMPASIPDLGRPVMKFGIQRAAPQAFNVLTKGVKGLNLSPREAKLIGAAVETVSNIRADQMLNLNDLTASRTLFERGLETVSSKIGTLGGFSQFTDGMKLLTASIKVAEISDNISLVLGHSKGTAKELAAARKALARDGIVDELPNLIWRELTEGKGGTKHPKSGVWMPNTEFWQNKHALRAYRAAIVKAADDTIITPGVSQPKYVDESLAHRLVFQFKSFAFETMNKTIVSGMQNADASVLYGSFFALALGAVSWYVRSIAAGGNAKKEMEEADLSRWADEMIDRSGLLGPLGIGRDWSQHVPGLRNLVTFSGEKTSRTQALGAIGALLGPSFDTFYTGVNTVQASAGLFDGDDETQFTRSDLHKIRTLIPYQNIFYLRRLFDQLENSIADAANMEGDPR